MRWQLLALLFLLTACGDLRRLLVPSQGQRGANGVPSENVEPPSPHQSQLQQQRMARERCYRDRPTLEAQMADLRRAEARLARVKGEVYSPSTPPEPWDEAQESRFRLEDQEADWQSHLKEQEEWKLREQSRRARWEADHQAQLRQAQLDLDRLARSLRARQPDLFTGQGSIEFNPLVIHRLRHCDTLKTLQPGHPGQKG